MTEVRRTIHEACVGAAKREFHRAEGSLFGEFADTACPDPPQINASNRKAAAGLSPLYTPQIGAHRVHGSVATKSQEKEVPTLRLAPAVSPRPYAPTRPTHEDDDSEMASRNSKSSGAMASSTQASTQSGASKPKPPHMTAVAAGGQSAPPPPIPGTAHPGMPDMQPVVAEVVPDEEDIEKRIRREAERIAFRERMARRNPPAATLPRYYNDGSTNNLTEDTITYEGTKTVEPSRRKCWIIVALIIVFVAGAAAGIGIAFSRGGGGGGTEGGGGGGSGGPGDTAPTDSPVSSCSFCANGASSSLASVDLARRSFQFGQQTVTCLAFQTDAESVLASDASCPTRQALSWKNCGCPTLPTNTPAELGCTICVGGVETSSQSEQCINEEQYVRIVGSHMPDKCPTLIQEAVVTCRCPTEEELRFRNFQTVVGALVSDQAVFDDSTSYQSRALTWLAVEDPLQLDPTSSSNEKVIQERFAVVSLYYATNGPGWTRTNMGFLSGASVCEWNSGDSGVNCVGSTTVTSIALSTYCVFA